MKLEPVIQRELDLLPVPYDFERRRSHVFLVVEGQPREVISSLGTKTSPRTVKACVVRIRRMRERLAASR